MQQSDNTQNHPLSKRRLVEGFDQRRAGGHVLEIIGVAGSGKTTLSRALARRDGRVRTGIPLSRIEPIRLYLCIAAKLLPAYLLHHRHTRWFTREEARAIGYLEAWRRKVQKRDAGGDAITVLDHGPIYRLVLLKAFGPPLTEDHSFRHWWDDAVSRWGASLDLIIWLDASSDVLKKRLRSREQNHVLKKQSEQEVDHFLGRYRAAYEHVAAALLSSSGVPLLRFDTNLQSPDRTADAVLTALDGLSAENS